MTHMWGHFYLLSWLHLQPTASGCSTLHTAHCSCCTAPKAAMAHTMLPLSTAQNTSAALKIAPKSPALKNSSNISLGAKCDNRRALLCGLIAAGAGAMLAPDIAHAASKRRAPPPAPAEEKKDPNVSGVQAKVLASKKRKEAMKEAVAKLRERGKPVDK